MRCNNPKLDVVNMNAYIKFGEKMSSSSQDIERKRNFSVNRALDKLYFQKSTVLVLFLKKGLQEIFRSTDCLS